MTTFCSVLLFLFLSAPSVLAQRAALPDSAPSREEVLKFFEVMHSRQQMDQVLTTMREQVSQSMGDMLEKQMSEMTPEQRSKFEAFVAGLFKEMFATIPIDELLEKMVPIYQKHLTKGDLEAIVAFFNSPAGQKLRDKQPQMIQESMQVSMAIMQERMKTIIPELQNKTEAFVTEMRAQGKADGKKSK